MDSLLMLTAVAGAFLLAGFVKGIIGMGLPTVAIGLLGLVTTPAQAAAILVVPSLVTNVWQLAVGGRLIELLRRLWPFLTAVCVGTLLGAVYLPRDVGGQATIWLGVLLVVYGVLGLVKVEFSVPPRAEPWLGPAVGLINGVVTAATGIFVLPGVPYIQALRMDRDALVQALGIAFTVATVALAGALSRAGEITTSLIAPALVGLAAALAGMVLGQLARGRIQPRTFRLCFFIGLLLLGAHLTLHGLL